MSTSHHTYRTWAGRRCVILLGAPGAGKGTQAAQLQRQQGYGCVSSGDLLRDHVARGTPPGIEADRFMRSGDLVPDSLITRIVVDALGSMSTADVVLDGYPKTAAQARLLDSALDGLGFGPRLAIHLTASPDVLRQRLRERGQLSGRPDDSAAVIDKRLKLLGTTAPDVVAHYRGTNCLDVVDGERPVGVISDRIGRAIDSFYSDQSSNPGVPADTFGTQRK